MTPFKRISSKIQSGEFGDNPSTSSKQQQILFRKSIREMFGHTVDDTKTASIFNKAWVKDHNSWESLTKTYVEITEQVAPETIFNGTVIMEQIIEATNEFMKDPSFLQYTKEVRRQKLVKFIREQAKELLQGRSEKKDIIESVLDHYENKYSVKLKQIIQEDDEDALDDMLDSDDRKEKDTDDEGSKMDDTEINKTEENTDTVTFDVPLLIRIMEYVREDVSTDVVLHRLVTNLIRIAKEKEVMNMDDYENILSGIRGSEIDYLRSLAGIESKKK